MNTITLNELISQLQKIAEHHGGERVMSIGTTSNGRFTIRTYNDRDDLGESFLYYTDKLYK